MALLIVPRDAWGPPPAQTSTSSSSTTPTSSSNQFGALHELVDPALRRKVARDVNEAILQSQGSDREAKMRELARTRGWTEHLARENKADVPDHMPLGLQGEAQTSSNGASNGQGQDTVMAENGSGAVRTG